MRTFTDYFKPLTEAEKMLQEALITFGGKAYPKFGNIVILAGGAGSGKGFTTDKLLGIEGKVLDVDRLKELSMASAKLVARIKEETGKDISAFNLKNPDDVSMIHSLLSDVYGLIDANERNVFKGIATAAPDRKPNLLFDVTMKDIKKLKSIAANAEKLGYNKENIHLVWVMNDVKVAMKQNKDRDRVVPDQILVGTHTGAASTMADILNMGDALKQYMDGDIWITFNKRGVDSKIEQSKAGGMYVVDSKYIQVKKKGQKSKTVADLSKDLVAKIKDYAPKSASFE